MSVVRMRSKFPDMEPTIKSNYLVSVASTVLTADEDWSNVYRWAAMGHQMKNEFEIFGWIYFYYIHIDAVVGHFY